jgi:hypothetical protein
MAPVAVSIAEYEKNPAAEKVSSEVASTPIPLFTINKPVWEIIFL